MKLYVLILILVLALVLAGCQAGEYTVVATVAPDPAGPLPESAVPPIFPPETVQALDWWLHP